MDGSIKWRSVTPTYLRAARTTRAASLTISEPRYSMLRSTSVVITCGGRREVRNAGRTTRILPSHHCAFRTHQARGVRVDAHVPGQQADVTKLVVELPVFLVAQRLQWRRVNDPLAVSVHV